MTSQSDNTSKDQTQKVCDGGWAIPPSPLMLEHGNNYHTCSVCGDKVTPPEATKDQPVDETNPTPQPNSPEDILNGMLQHYKARWNRLTPNEEYDENLPDLDWFEAQQALDQYYTNKFLEIVDSGEGRKTGVWHYELNDRNQMEASVWGKYLSIAELRQAIKQLSNGIE